MSRVTRPKASKPTEALALNPAQVLNYLLTSGATTDAVREAMAIANEWNAREAERVFGERFAAFQAKLPQIEKTRAVKRKNGEVMYYFANLEDVDRIIQPIKAEFGLSTSGAIKNQPHGIEVVWEIQIGSHCKRREYLLPPIPVVGLLEGGANATQNLGAWMRYIWRYTYTMALGVQVKDEDTDGVALKAALLLDDDQKKQLRDWTTTGALVTDPRTGEQRTLVLEVDRLLAWKQPNLPVEERSLDKLTQDDFESIVKTFALKYTNNRKDNQ
jgi:hypothetical protein